MNGQPNEIFEALAAADPFQSWWPIIVAIAFGFVMTIRTYMGGQMCPAGNSLPGQVIIVTGASGGIGWQIAREMCLRRATVILACRNLVKANAAMQRILAAQPDALCEVRHLDLASLDSVRHFASAICADFPKVHGLVNNAGLMLSRASTPLMTGDGFEQHLQVNYLSGALLVELLRERLERAGGRVVNTSAHGYIGAASWLSADDPLNVGEWRRAYAPRDAFAQSKMLVVLGSRAADAACALPNDGPRMTVNAYTPGIVFGTEHLRHSPVMSAWGAKIVIVPWLWLFAKTPVQAAQTAIYLLAEPALAGVGGKFFNDCTQTELVEAANDQKLAAKVHEITRKALGLAS